MSVKNNKLDEPIDAVITWVDGQDDTHAKKLSNYLLDRGIVRPIEGAAPTRFNAVGEIEFCIRSILRFAPWIRTIYVVTDAQAPPILKTFIGTEYDDKIKCIDHRDIFNGHLSLLPTFNSISIEAMLWRIEGLANQFIYFNDDNFLIRAVTPHDFFRDRKVVVRGKMKIQSNKKSFYRTVQEKSAQFVGFKWRYLHLEHVPHALRRDLFDALLRDYPEKYIKNAAFAFRDQQQIWPISWVYHVALKAHTLIRDKQPKAVMVNPAHHSLEKITSRLNRAARDKRVAFLCVQSLDEADENTRRIILDWLHQNISSL